MGDEMRKHKSTNPRLQGINLKYMFSEFTDEDQPAHPFHIVSTESLMRAFESDKRCGLTNQSALELVRLAAGAICKKEQFSRYLTDLQEGALCEKALLEMPAECGKLQAWLHSTPASTLTQELPSYLTAAAISMQWSLI